MKKETIQQLCHELIYAYEHGLLGDTTMPEDHQPERKKGQENCRLAYFTLPMSLNYQRNSFHLRKAALATREDATTKNVFDYHAVTAMTTEQLRKKLLKHKLALQPNKHVNTRQRISSSLANQRPTYTDFFQQHEYDFLLIQKTIQQRHKKGFPYLSGPKIFHYRSHIIQRYGGINLRNSQQIQIAPDTHVIQASVHLGIRTQEQIDKMSKEEISTAWRLLLEGMNIAPIHIHSPLWFRSRSGFEYSPPSL